MSDKCRTNRPSEARSGTRIAKDRRFTADWCERDPRLVAPNDAKSDDALVVPERSRNVGDLQANSPYVRREWEAKPRGDDAVLLGIRGGTGYASRIW